MAGWPTRSLMKTLIERLQERAEQDLACAINSEAVAEGLGEQMRRFEERTSDHNTYAVRVHLDHRNGARRDRQNAADLLEVIKLLSSMASLPDMTDQHYCG